MELVSTRFAFLGLTQEPAIAFRRRQVEQVVDNVLTADGSRVEILCLGIRGEV